MRLSILALGLALLASCAGKPPKATASAPVIERPGAPPPRQELIQGEPCKHHRECAAHHECRYLSDEPRCLRRLSVAELMGWRRELDGIAVLVHALDLVAVNWVCTTATECVAERAISVEDDRKGPVKDYVRLVRKNGEPLTCQRLRGHSYCRSWFSKSFKIFGRYDAKRDVFIVDLIEEAL